MSGAVHQVRGDHLRARDLLHALERAGVLIHTPVAPAADEHRRHVDGAAGEQLLFRREAAAGAGAIALEPALETGSSIFGAVDAQFRLG